jgi:excisionase family DNA binding protein
MDLGADLAQAWNSAGVTAETRKRIIRLMIREIVVDISDDTLPMVIHWQGGDHTRLIVKKNKVGQTRWTVAGETLDLVRVLARQMPDQTIASVLNRAGKVTGKGNTWTRSRVCGLRNNHDIAAYCEGERQQRGEVTLDEAASTLKVSPSTVRRMITEGILPAKQICKGAPWIIRLSDVQNEGIQQEADARRTRRPTSQDPKQKVMEI